MVCWLWVVMLFVIAGAVLLHASDAVLAVLIAILGVFAVVYVRETRRKFRVIRGKE